MQESTRRQYLNAMGINVWCLRDNISAGDGQGGLSAERSAPEFDSKESETDAKELFQLSSNELEPWLGNQRLLRIYSGDAGTNSLGNPDARLMVLSQCLLRDKLSHQPFTGRSGSLLRAMLRTINQDTESVLLGELDTPNQEAKRLTDHLHGKKVRALLLLMDLPEFHDAKELEKFRSREFTLGPTQIRVVVSFHPDYLLSNPQAKALAWQDLKMLRSLMDVS